MKNFISISIVIIMLLIVGDVSSQTTKTWSGGTSTAWATAANWSPSGVPASTDHVVFNGTGTFQPTLDANRTVANITVTGNTVNLNSKILTVTGTTTLTGGTVNSGTISFTNTTTTFAGTTFGSKVKFSGGNVYFNGSTFNGVVDVVKGGAGTNNSTGGNTFNDSLKIKLTSNGTITMHSSTSNDAFNGHINISNVYCFTCITGYGSVYFGAVGGTGVGTLASGKTISIGSSGFAGATLGFIRFTQSGSTAQSITLTGSAVFKLGDKSGGTLAPTTWNGNLTVSSPNILIENSTFNGTATFSKTGTSSNVCNGNNTFNSTCTYNVNNSGYLTLANITGDTHNGASNFNRASSGLIYPAYNGDNYFYGNIAVGTNNGAVTLNNSGSGTINFNGSASQTLSKTGTGLITIKSMVMGKTSNSLTLNTPIQVSGTSAFNGGKIITTSTNLITYIDNATVSGASNASFVSGPAAKVGDDAFSFPTGKSSSYRPIDITSPSSASTVFTAQYFAANQSLGSTLDTGYVKISNCEYWTMTRSGSSNTVNVTLGWDNNSCNYAVPTKMRVVGWDGSKWKNYGNNTSTGTSTIGTVLSNTNPTSYTAFTLGNAGALEQPNVYEVWTTTAGTQNLFYKNITKVDGSFNTYVAGATVDSTGSYDMIVSKYNSSGVLSWTKQYNGAGNGNDMAADVLIDGSGNVYITGAAYVSAPNSYDLIVIKYNSGGTQQWVYTYNGGGSLYDGGISLRLSGSDLFVTGGAFNSSLNSDFATIKLSSSTGTQQWVNIWNSSWNKNDLPVKMDVGSGDTLLVTGMTQKTTNTYRIAALKLSKTSGSVLATNSYLTSDSTTMSTVTDIAEDDYHNIYVTGTISNGVSASSGVDFHTIKINYSDLHIAWQHSYSSDTTAEDQANSIDVDLNGNVYVSGYVTKNNQRDIAIIKYNSSGTLQWEQKYDQANGSDEGNAIIVDDLGTYIYTAGSIYSGSNTDYATMCYSSLGELKWIIAYNAPYVGNDQAFDITLDSLTNIYVSGQTQTGSSTSNYTTVKYGQLNLPLDVESTGTAGYINDQIIVKFRDGNLKMSAINNKGKLAGYIGDFINASTIDSLQAKLGTRLKHLPVFKVFTNMTEGDSLAINRQGDTIKVPKFWATLLLTLPSGYEEQTAIDSLNKLRNIVVFSQKNGVFMSTSSPNDPQYANQNSLESTTFTNADINIENAWNYETGKDYIKLAVIGSGYNGHTDLQRPNVNGGFTDILSGGKNFITGGSIFSPPDNDASGHETQVMGIIGAVRNNGIGIAGIAGGDATNSDFGIKKFSMKITGGGNNTTQLLCNSIYESVSGVDFSMNILNLSLSTSEYNQLLWEMYRYSSQMGVVMVSSSGNYPANANSVNAILYPACVKKDWNICVGASGINGELKVNGNGNSLDNLDNQYQSIHGGDFVDVIAPGTNAMVKTVNGLVPTSFVSFTGTSAAAPHVSAVAGLVLSYWNQPQPDNSNLAPEDVSYLITRTATDKIPAGQPDNSTGWGLLNGGNIFTTYSQPEYSIYHNSVPTSRTVTMYHANTGIFIPDQNYPDVDNLAYIGDVYEVTETVDHNFPLNYEIVDYWIRNSGQSMGVQLSLINGFYTLTSAETDIVFDSFDQNTAVTKSYVCFLKDKWPNIPYNVWFPYNPNNGNAQTHNYSVLLKDLAVSTNEQISGNGDAKLFPNPATDNVTIELSNNKSTSVEIKVTDISGRTLIDKKYSLSLGTNRINLDVSSLANSVYFVNLQTNAKNENIKFVKSK